jgi:hypothetical protein
MPVNFQTYMTSWAKAVNDKNTSMLSDLLADDFVWVNDRLDLKFDKQVTLAWCRDTPYKAGDFSCYYENNEVLVGIHDVIEPNTPDSSVMFIAKIIDGKIVSHHYLREFER